MEDLSFTDDEVCRALAEFGHYCPPNKIKEFKQALEDVIREDRSRSVSLSTSTSDVSYGDARPYQSNGGGDRRDQFEVPEPRFRNLPSHSYAHDFSKEMQHSDILKTSVHSSEPANLKSCLKKSVLTNYGEPETYVRDNITHSGDIRALRHGDVETSTAFDDNLSQDGSTNSERRVIQRKVLRKHNGRVEIHNESISENDSDNLSCLDDQMRNLRLNTLNHRPASAPPKAPASASSGHQSHVACREHSSYNLPDDYLGPKALIRPMSCEPHMQNIKRTDPVSRYQKYRQSWDMCKAPGERSHNRLRWDIRGQMLYHDQVVVKRPQPVHQPNPYVVPGDKKRKTLRWQIRQDLAQGIKPPSMFD